MNYSNPRLRRVAQMEANLQEFKAWAIAHKPDAIKVIAAQGFAELEKSRVDDYIEPLFRSYQFHYSGHLAEKLNLTGPLPNQDELYLCEDERIDEYYEACDKAHREHGFTGEHGFCPALVADTQRREAENAFLRLGCDLIGLEDIPSRPEQRKKLLDLLLGACLIDPKKGEKNVHQNPRE